METLFGRNIKMIMRNKQIDPDAVADGSKANTGFI